MDKQPHFDASALIAAVYQQPIGLAVSTNHPPGFRRLLYLEGRRDPAKKVQILQSPQSASLFLLVRADVDADAVAIEHGAETEQSNG